MRDKPKDSAFFLARDDELDAAFPGWTRTKQPDTDAKIPLEPPFPHVQAPFPREWWTHLADYYSLLVPDDEQMQQMLLDESVSIDERNEAAFPQVLFAGPTSPFVCRARPELVARAETITDDECARIAKALSLLYVPNDRWVHPLTLKERDLSDYRVAYERGALVAMQTLRGFLRNRRPEQEVFFWGWWE